MSIGCKICGSCDVPFFDPVEDDYCAACTEISIERSRYRREWDEYHDEPCPEIELPQFPRKEI